MKKKLLIVDDDSHIRTLLGLCLEKLQDDGIEFFFAANGQDALQTIKTELPNLVFLDVMMPDMDGFSVCKKVRELNLPNITIVMLTATGQKIDQDKAKEVGANVFLTKPFDPSEVLEKARLLLNEQT